MAKSTNSDSELTELNHELRLQVDGLREELHRIQLQNDALQELVRNLQRDAMTDNLTGIWNRRYFDLEISKYQSRLDSTGEAYCLVLIDFDHLKQTNDEFGHVVGDAVLQDVSERLKSASRPTDILARIGGDEFTLLMPKTAHAEAKELVAALSSQIDLSGIGERAWEVRRRFGVRNPCDDGHKKVEVSLSFGVAQAIPGEPVARLLDRADRDLYESKKISRKQKA